MLLSWNTLEMLISWDVKEEINIWVWWHTPQEVEARG
jgi:hypothetical protein